MAVTTQKSDQITATETLPIVNAEQADVGGKVRTRRFTFTQSGAGDATSTVELCKLPAGRIRILLSTSIIANSAFGSSRVLDIGYRAHTNIDGTAVVESATAIKDDLSVASAATNTMAATAGAEPTLSLNSRSGVTLFATVAGGTIPDGATLKGYVQFQAA